MRLIAEPGGVKSYMATRFSWCQGPLKNIVSVRNAQLRRPSFVGKIESGAYENYHVRVINGVKTPVSNPDGSEGNNLD